MYILYPFLPKLVPLLSLAGLKVYLFSLFIYLYGGISFLYEVFGVNYLWGTKSRVVLHIHVVQRFPKLEILRGVYSSSIVYSLR